MPINFWEKFNNFFDSVNKNVWCDLQGSSVAARDWLTPLARASGVTTAPRAKSPQPPLTSPAWQATTV